MGGKSGERDREMGEDLIKMYYVHTCNSKIMKMVIFKLREIMRLVLRACRWVSLRSFVAWGFTLQMKLEGVCLCTTRLWMVTLNSKPHKLVKEPIVRSGWHWHLSVWLSFSWHINFRNSKLFKKTSSQSTKVFPWTWPAGPLNNHSVAVSRLTIHKQDPLKRRSQGYPGIFSIAEWYFSLKTLMHNFLESG